MAQTKTVTREPVSEHLKAIVSGRLRQALLLTVAILIVELAGAVWSHSLALFSDAGHVTTDIFALGLAWFAVKQTAARGRSAELRLPPRRNTGGDG